MHCGFKCQLLTLWWWVACHWPTNIFIMCSVIPTTDDQAIVDTLCNATVHRSSLVVVHRQHRLMISSTTPHLLLPSLSQSFTTIQLDSSTWSSKPVLICVPLEAELWYIIKLINCCSSRDGMGQGPANEVIHLHSTLLAPHGLIPRLLQMSWEQGYRNCRPQFSLEEDMLQHRTHS